MFHKVLVANRGEIAVRIIRSLKEMGIKSVAVYSQADAECLHTLVADEAICIGPASVADSYLNKVALINAALITGAEAIHPGFGFLSENAAFASLCEKYGITFIGPTAETISMAGDKASARAVMEAAGLPVIPGSDGEVADAKSCYALAERLGYPVLLKATAGGGGKGMRFVYRPEEMEKAFESGAMEAKNAFGNGGLYMEKVIVRPRHIEVQILGDCFGNVIHLGERDCSLQRRNQKVIEEAPAIQLSEEMLRRLREAAVRGGRAAGYHSAGTIEFLVDADENFYFMEMNTRIQVEHPITECITGVDIVREQVKIAAGERLSLKQEDVRLQGNSIECRINACRPTKGFQPSCGQITGCILPGGPGIRVDTHIYHSYAVPPFYDSMLCKIISYGADRDEARIRMIRALSETVISGVDTNIDYLLDILKSEAFAAGALHTGYLEEV